MGPLPFDQATPLLTRVRRLPLRSKEGKYNWDRSTLYQRTLRSQFAIPKLVGSMGEKNPLAAGMLVRELLDEVGGLELHLGMFIPTIQGQGDAEQQKHWLPQCYATRVIGTYGQTELGHGTFLRGAAQRCQAPGSGPGRLLRLRLRPAGLARRRAGDDSHVRRLHRRVRHTLADAGSHQVVAGRPGQDVQPRGGDGTPRDGRLRERAAPLHRAAARV